MRIVYQRGLPPFVWELAICLGWCCAKGWDQCSCRLWPRTFFTWVRLRNALSWYYLLLIHSRCISCCIRLEHRVQVWRSRTDPPIRTRLFKNVCACPSDALLQSQLSADFSTAHRFILGCRKLHPSLIWGCDRSSPGAGILASPFRAASKSSLKDMIHGDIPVEDLIRPVLFPIFPWIIGSEDISIWTVLFWLCSHLSHTAVLCKAFSLCSESQTLEWRECKNGAKPVCLLTAWW